MSEAADKPAAASAAGGGNKMLLLLVLVFNVLLAGGIGYLVLSGRGHAAEKPKHEEGAEKGEGEKEGEAEAEEPAAEGGEAKGGKHSGTFGPLLEVGSFVANLAPATPGAQSRYAKVNISIEVANEEVKKKVETATVPVRSEALMFFTNAKPDDVVGQDKIRGLAEELQKRFNALLGKGVVKRVYFAELVVQ
ncbi:MAG TPA: flagellar basal body-associated FliL family protein [Polyangiales bacterium]|nr:flagellar basal body-associated FliL family protein [Polyangiales bacterium]